MAREKAVNQISMLLEVESQYQIDLLHKDTHGHLSFKINKTQTSLHCHGGSLFNGEETGLMFSAEYFRKFFIEPLLQKEIETKGNAINEVADNIALATLQIRNCKSIVCGTEIKSSELRITCDNCGFTFHKKCIPNLKPKSGKFWKPFHLKT